MLSEFNIEDSSGDAPQAQYAVHDLEAGRRVPVWGNENAGGPNTEVGDLIDLLVAQGGRTAGRFNAPFAGTGEPPVSVVGFDPNGKAHVLDTAAAGEIGPLSVDGTLLSWTNKGQPRTADLATL